VLLSMRRRRSNGVTSNRTISFAAGSRIDGVDNFMQLLRWAQALHAWNACSELTNVPVRAHSKCGRILSTHCVDLRWETSLS
jgi:hypothetical protein